MTEGADPGVSVLVVYHSGGADLRRALASLAGQGAFEVVVVDNSGGDGVVDALCPPAGCRLRRLRPQGNVGFAAGANCGMKAARGGWLLLMNPDAELCPGALQELLARTADGVTAVAPRIVWMDDPERLDNAGHDLMGDGLNWCRGRGQEAALWEDQEDPLLFSGAAVLLRREPALAVGGFTEAHFAYGEDADLGLRLLRLGGAIRYAPRAIVRHRVGGAFGRFGWRKTYLVERNRVDVALVHLPFTLLLRAPWVTVARTLRLVALASRGEGLVAGYPPRTRWLLPLVIAAADFHALIRVPASLRRRRQWGRDVARLGGLSSSAWSAFLRPRVRPVSVVDDRGPAA